jgi:hypothetical protein
LIAIVSVTSARGQGLIETARNTAWTVQNIGRVKQLFPDRLAVETFVRQLDGGGDVPPNVGEYTLVDLRHDGTIQLVATLDFSG